MNGNARNIHSKARLLLRLYSLWHVTRREAVRRQCLALLGEILRIKPQFNPREEFKIAF